MNLIYLFTRSLYNDLMNESDQNIQATTLPLFPLALIWDTACLPIALVIMIINKLFRFRDK